MKKMYSKSMKGTFCVFILVVFIFQGLKAQEVNISKDAKKIYAILEDGSVQTINNNPNAIHIVTNDGIVRLGSQGAERVEEDSVTTIDKENTVYPIGEGTSRIYIIGYQKGMLLYLDDMLIPPDRIEDVLKSLDPFQVENIEVIQPSEAIPRFGTKAKLGVILVSRKKNGGK